MKFLKTLHSEQINKLVLKNQHECDLLEDIRTFIIKRSAIEKSYSEVNIWCVFVFQICFIDLGFFQALLKISSAYLNKKIPNIPDIKLDGGDEKWWVFLKYRPFLWKHMSIFTNKLQLARSAVIFDTAKHFFGVTRTYKLCLYILVNTFLYGRQKKIWFYLHWTSIAINHN